MIGEFKGHNHICLHGGCAKVIFFTPTRLVFGGFKHSHELCCGLIHLFLDVQITISFFYEVHCILEDGWCIHLYWPIIFRFYELIYKQKLSL